MAVSNSLYHESQTAALAMIGNITSRAATAGLPEITWQIGLQGAQGTCPSRQVFDAYVAHFGANPREFRWGVSATFGGGVHIRHTPDPECPHGLLPQECPEC